MSKKGGQAGHYLPSWFRDEDMLRRILLMRRDGRSLAEIFKTCGISRAGYDAVRRAARSSRFPGNRVWAAAWVKLMDECARTAPRGYLTPVSEEDGKLLAENMLNWKLTGFGPVPGEEDDEE